MKVYSYVVARDYGFAPNPFYGVCTLATCKPLIRKHAKVGDWVVGTGSKGYGLEGKLVYAMKISETLTFDAYWNDPRFSEKKPNLKGSFKQAYGDNIYHHSKTTGKWLQENSHHSHATGGLNMANIKHDTQAPRVLLGTEYAYWGGSGPIIPAQFRRGEMNVCCQRGHKCNFPDEFIISFVKWIESLGLSGFISPPKEFKA